jgi:exonuclease SbcD
VLIAAITACALSHLSHSTAFIRREHDGCKGRGAGIGQWSHFNMRILHTADWHLGRSLGGFELLDLVQRPALEEVVRIAKESRPDAIVIAGDLYDRSVPPESAMHLFEETVLDLGEIAPVLAIAGNHDGAGRVGHFATILRRNGTHIFAREFGAVPSVSLHDNHGEVRFHLMPFAMPAETREAFAQPGTEDDRSMSSHEAATAARIKTIELSPSARHVLVGHLFTARGSGDDGNESDSERDISVGGSSIVSPSNFDGFAYVALGHLHKPHDVVDGRIRYAGSIARYSFSEESHAKSVSLIEIDAGGKSTVEKIEIAQPIGMRTLHGEFNKLLAAANSDSQKAQDFVRVQLTDASPQFEAFRRLREHYPYLIELNYERSASGGVRSPAADQETRRAPMAMFEAYCTQRVGPDVLTPAMKSLAQKMMEAARDARGRGEVSGAQA